MKNLARPALGALAAAIAFCAWGAAAAERGAPNFAERSVLDYKIYFGGFAAVALEIDLARTGQDYRISARLRTLGVIDRFFPWTMRAYSRGRIAGAEPRPAAAGQASDWRGRKRLVDIRYDGGRPIVERLAPTDRDDRTPVSEDDMRGTVDLASAVLSLTLDAEAGNGCARVVPVFDGRRRYDLIAERIGVEPIRKVGRAGHYPRALKCRVSMVRRSGFKKTASHDLSEPDRRSATLWLARAGAGMPPVPVRVEVETRWGLVIGHLMRVRPAVTAGR